MGNNKNLSNKDNFKKHFIFVLIICQVVALTATMMMWIFIEPYYSSSPNNLSLLFTVPLTGRSRIASMIYGGFTLGSFWIALIIFEIIYKRKFFAPVLRALLVLNSCVIIMINCLVLYLFATQTITTEINSFLSFLFLFCCICYPIIFALNTWLSKKSAISK